MPTYAYKCGCGRVRDVVKPLARLNCAETCICGEVMGRQISAVRVVGDYAGYDCPVTGKRIEGRRAHHENLKRQGCRVLEPGEKEQNESRRQQEERSFEASVDHTVESFVHNLPTEKRDRLITEIAAGADTSLTRSTPT